MWSFRAPATSGYFCPPTEEGLETHSQPNLPIRNSCLLLDVRFVGVWLLICANVKGYICIKPDVVGVDMPPGVFQMQISAFGQAGWQMAGDVSEIRVAHGNSAKVSANNHCEGSASSARTSSTRFLWTALMWTIPNRFQHNVWFLFKTGKHSRDKSTWPRKTVGSAEDDWHVFSWSFYILWTTSWPLNYQVIV